jgi:hypothetical protein
MACWLSQAERCWRTWVVAGHDSPPLRGTPPSDTLVSTRARSGLHMEAAVGVVADRDVELLVDGSTVFWVGGLPCRGIAPSFSKVGASTTAVAKPDLSSGARYVNAGERGRNGQNDRSSTPGSASLRGSSLPGTRRCRRWRLPPVAKRPRCVSGIPKAAPRPATRARVFRLVPLGGLAVQRQ